MKKQRLNTNTRVSDLSLDELFEDSSDWELKAERLLTRRLKKIRLLERA